MRIENNKLYTFDSFIFIESYVFAEMVLPSGILTENLKTKHMSNSCMKLEKIQHIAV